MKNRINEAETKVLSFFVYEMINGSLSTVVGDKNEWLE